MKVRCYAVSFAIVCMLAGCGRDPKEVEITEQNKEKFLEEIKDDRMTVEEARLLHAYVLRASMSKALGGDQLELAGKTVGDLIREEREFEEKAKQEQAKADKLAAEAKAKEDAVAQALRKAIVLTVFSKSYQDSDYRSGQYQDEITIRCAYENTSGKDIRAFAGEVKFADLFGKDIFSCSLTIQDGIKAGAKSTWTGTIDYNQFLDSHRSLRATDLKDMQVTWVPKQILYGDGTKAGLGE